MVQSYKINAAQEYELMLLAEMKALVLKDGFHDRLNMLEEKAYMLCSLYNEFNELVGIDQESYDKHIRYYEKCRSLLESGKKIPTKKIEKILTVVRSSSAIVGAMSWETPYIIFSDSEGRIYKWISETIEHKGLYLAKAGRRFNVKAFVRHGTGHLYRVSVTDIP